MYNMHNMTCMKNVQNMQCLQNEQNIQNMPNMRNNMHIWPIDDSAYFDFFNLVKSQIHSQIQRLAIWHYILRFQTLD